MPQELARGDYEVIQEAIKENRFGEYLLYGISVVVVFSGFTSMMVGLWKGDSITTLAGSIGSGLFFPALLHAKKIRDQKMAVKLLEIALNRANSADEAVSLLRQFFESTIPNQSERLKKQNRPSKPGQVKGERSNG